MVRVVVGVEKKRTEADIDAAAMVVLEACRMESADRFDAGPARVLDINGSSLGRKASAIPKRVVPKIGIMFEKGEFDMVVDMCGTDDGGVYIYHCARSADPVFLPNYSRIISSLRLIR